MEWKYIQEEMIGVGLDGGISKAIIMRTRVGEDIFLYLGPHRQSIYVIQSDLRRSEKWYILRRARSLTRFWRCGSPLTFW